MRVLVTGHRGFLGSHFYSYLEERGDLVVGVEKETGISPEGWPKGRFGFDLVIHCAVNLGGLQGMRDETALMHNIAIDTALLEWAIRAKPAHVVYFSSAAVYGPPDQVGNIRGGWRCVPFREPQAHFGLIPNFYGQHKFMAEVLCEVARREGLNVHVVRPFNCYSHEQSEAYPFRAILGRVRRREDPLTIWSTGQQVRDFIHVDDVVRAVLAIVDADESGPVNVGTGVATTIDELALLMAKKAGYSPELFHDVEGLSSVDYRVADVTKLHEFYVPAITLEAGIERALACPE